MTIRKATIEDVERIADLFGQLGYAAQAERVERGLRALDDSALGQAFVAEAGTVLAGVAVVHLMQPIHVDAAWALLSALVVDEAHRSSGVGAQLLAAAERFALDHGCSQLELSSSATRTRAHRFYERNGYREKRLRFLKTLK
jgi:GNAT superfamily N-acetyltransferase